MNITQLLFETEVYTSQRAIDICQINERTWKRWLREKHIRRRYRLLLEHRGKTDTLWDGYRIDDRYLITPNGENIQKVTLDEWWIIKQKLRRYDQLKNAPVQYLIDF